ncbi:hypothetical protein PVL29_002483 [Vitis rotundifolia]|uniref:Uncharacterized protein n=1 Tax=Vitis rotundifolia TaxID=103349 RepID=A0AA39E5N8_VITRO|nr:hypothetical protein PVL29_002483 [Vitis rotundifolia]
MSGQMSGQVPNQAGSQLPGLPQQNGSSLPSQIQNLDAHRNTGNMDPDTVRSRKRVQVKIYEYITQRQSSPHDLQPKRVADIVRRLDDVLFRSAATKEDYANLDTLESRLHGLIKGPPLRSHNQQFPQAVNSSSVGIHSGSFNSSDGSLCHAYQRSTSSFSVGSGGNSIMSSMSGLRITSQMIPTPEFNSNNNQSHLNSESSDDRHGQKAGGT